MKRQSHAGFVALSAITIAMIAAGCNVEAYANSVNSVNIVTQPTDPQHVVYHDFNQDGVVSEDEVFGAFAAYGSEVGVTAGFGTVMGGWPEGCTARRVLSWKYASITSRATGSATSAPSPPLYTNATTEISGLLNGA